MLRITESPLPAAAAPGRRAILLEGRLIGPWVAELTRVLGDSPGDQIRLDLDGLSFADANGLALLRSLRAAGAELVGSSAFMAASMGAAGEGEGRPGAE